MELFLGLFIGGFFGFILSILFLYLIMEGEKNERKNKKNK